MDDSTKIERLLYSYDDWDTVARGKGPNYCLEIQGHNQVLFYFGANHSRALTDSQYPKLEAYWQEFLQATDRKNSIVLVEGGVRKVYSNDVDAVAKESEAGFITRRAHGIGIHIKSPEPSPVEERDYVLAKFPEDELNLYYFARLVNRWNTLPEPRGSFVEFMRQYIVRKQEITNWVDHGFPLEEMKRIHKKILNVTFNQDDKELFSLLINPTRTDNPLREVVIALQTFRNMAIVKEIVELWNARKSVFIVFGAAHPILQEPALRKLLT